MGTYVDPMFRKQGIAKELHVAAELRGKMQGFTRIDRVASGGEGEKMLLRDGWKATATIYSKEL